MDASRFHVPPATVTVIQKGKPAISGELMKITAMTKTAVDTVDCFPALEDILRRRRPLGKVGYAGLGGRLLSRRCNRSADD